MNLRITQKTKNPIFTNYVTQRGRGGRLSPSSLPNKHTSFTCKCFGHQEKPIHLRCAPPTLRGFYKEYSIRWDVNRPGVESPFHGPTVRKSAQGGVFASTYSRPTGPIYCQTAQFRMIQTCTYVLVLKSSRLAQPKHLLGWTKVWVFSGKNCTRKYVAYTSHKGCAVPELCVFYLWKTADTVKRMGMWWAQ